MGVVREQKGDACAQIFLYFEVAWQKLLRRYKNVRIHLSKYLDAFLI